MLVSVVMSVYNSDKYLDDAIKSIINQSYKEFEFLIIDDGSTDNSEAIIKKYAANDSRIVFIKNETNLGLASSLNKGIQLARGKYIARQDADDLSSLNRLEKQIHYAIENEQIDLIGSNLYLIDVNGEVVYENRSHSKKTEYLNNLLNHKAIFPHGSALIKKDKLVESGLYDSRFYYSQDGELWLRLITNGANVHTIDEPLYYYRSGPRAFDNKHKAQSRYNVVKRMIYADHIDPKIVDKELENIKNQILTGSPVPRAHHMADYWKSLANGSYLNGGKLSTSYKYIIKALREKNSLKNYVNFLTMGVMYIFPPKMIKQLFKIDQGTVS